jgi:hypothetical protein
VEESYPLPPPIIINCWKHQAGFIIKQIKSIRDIRDLDELKFFLLKIGESQMDLYFGKYSPQEISEHIFHILNQKKIFKYEQYKDWLVKDGKTYQLLKLKDRSDWTLRLGDDIARYVHIHPGRHSPQTVRVKATTLKTAILLLCFEQLGETKSFETETVNQIRMKFLKEPPLKSLAGAYGLKRLINLLRNDV